MKKSELIARLESIEGDPEVCILDGFNAGGQPRALNFGPLTREGKAQFRGDVHADYSDIDSKDGERIIIMGYGCY